MTSPRETPPAKESIGTRDLTRWRTPAGRRLAHTATRAVRSSANPATPLTVLAVTAILGGIVLVGAASASGEIYEQVHDSSGLARMDHPALDAMMSVRTPWLNQAVTWFTDLGGPLLGPAIAVLLAALLSWRWRSWAPVVLVGLGGVVSLGITILGKHLVGRARPPLADAVPPYELSASFPSGHTLNATMLAGVLAYLVLVRTRTSAQRLITVTLAALWAVAMGLSRVYLGHHWLTDVLVGWTLGVAVVAVVVTAHRLFLTTRRARAEGAPATDTVAG